MIFYLAIVNSSGWPTTKVITLSNKTELISGLVLQEVVLKREAQLQSFRKGLDYLGVLQLLQMSPLTLKPVLVYEERPLSADDFINNMKTIVTQNDKQQSVAAWFSGMS